MKILFLTSGSRVPSTRFRVLKFLPHLRAEGHQCVVAHSMPEKYDHWPILGWRLSQQLKRIVRFWHLFRARFGRYDVIFIERELFNNNTSDMEERFRRIARRMVLDVDDAIFLENPEKFARIARISDVVIAGNRFLKEHIEPLNPNIVVIPTCVDLLEYVPKASPATPAERIVIGWIGTTGNLNYLRVVAEALRNLATRCDFELRLVSPGDGPLASIDLSGVRVKYIRWDPHREIEHLHGFDLGIMPLRMDQKWDIYKCGFKLIQYMAVGLPAVASPVGVNADIVQQGENGFLATTPEEWEEYLGRLVQDAELRKRLGSAARRRIEEGYSVQVHLPRLIETLKGASQQSSGLQT